MTATAVIATLAGLAVGMVCGVFLTSGRARPPAQCKWVCAGRRAKIRKARLPEPQPAVHRPLALLSASVQPEPEPGVGSVLETERIAVGAGVLTPDESLDPARQQANDSTTTPTTEADVFASRVVGTSSKHAHLPWHLPPEPAQSGVAADQAEAGDLMVRAASVVGIGHRLARPAQARQDSYRLGVDGAGAHLVIAVSDGVSAAPLAELGAAIACRAAVDAVRVSLNAGVQPAELDVRQVFNDAARFMAGAADQRGVRQSDLAAVMVIAVLPVRPDKRGTRRAWCAWLGDAGVWLRVESMWRRLAGDDKAGLDRNHVAAALPHGRWQGRSTVVELGPDSVVTVATDGIGDALGRTEFAAWFAARWRRPPALASFLMDVDFDARQATDDRTAVTVWCGTAGRHGR